MDNVYLKKSKIGRGIFAKKDIKKGELLGIFKGKIIPDTEEALEKYGDYLLPVNYEEAMLVGNIFKYTNHSCDPNCGVKGGIKIIALRDIKNDEEVTIDYDTLEYDWEMDCKCESPKCRKKVRGYKHLSKDLKKKYKGFIAPYLLKKPVRKELEWYYK